MGLEEILKRTAARKAAGVNQTYPKHVKTPTLPPTQGERLRLALPVLSPCGRLGDATGETRQCPTCSGSVQVKLFSCPLHGQCTIAKKIEGAECCRTCSDHTARSGDQPRLDGAQADYGVAIGSYGWPELVELQIKAVRASNGAVPILVSSDDPASHAAVATVCAKYDDVTFWPNATRIGHTGGDISVFWKAIRWGAARGMKVVAKLSQRFVITKRHWLENGAIDLLASGLPLATQKARGSSDFDLRTEACLLDVAKWNNPVVLSRIVPRKYWKDNPNGLTAETVIFRVLQDLLGGYFYPWDLFGEERREKNDGVLWHNADNEPTYRALAERMGVTLPPTFHTHGWQHELRKGTYDFG